MNSSRGWRRLAGTSRLIVLWAAVSAVTTSLKAHDETPGAAQDRPVALVGGTVITSVGDPIEGGTVTFADGRITGVGKDLAIPEGAEVIDVSGKFVYPGFFESHSRIGLTEIDQVPATIDTSETGDINSNVKALVAVNPDSEVIPVTRANGILISVTSPQGGLVSGQAAVIQLDGWTWEDMALRDVAAMEINWPSDRSRRFRRRGGRGGDNYADRIQELSDLFDDARAWQAGQAANGNQPLDLRLAAMGPVLNGDVPLLVRADSQKQIQDAVAFATSRNLRLIILGGYEAPACAELLKQHDIPVIISSVQRRPEGREDDFDQPYRLAETLRQKGILFSISASDRATTWNTRILPEQAGMAVAYGLPYDEAIRAITLNPAKIFGVSDHVGSLEPGKHATLFVSDGDALEITSHVTHAWMQGRPVNLASRHTRLRDKYEQKYEELEGRR